MKVINLSKIMPNPDNPRVIRDTQYARLLDSIKRDPQFLDKRGIVHADNIILGGNQRYQALLEATRDPDFRERIGTRNEGDVPAAWIVDASEWTEEQRRRFVLIDNSPAGIAGEWDWDKLANEWDIETLDICGMDVPEIQEPVAEGKKSKLPDKPPPSMSWVLIGIPTNKYHLIYDAVQAISLINDVFCEVTSNDQAS